MYAVGNYPLRTHECFGLQTLSNWSSSLIVATTDDYCKVIEVLCGAGTDVIAKVSTSLLFVI